MNQEGLNLEYKRDYVEDIKKTVVAFANTSGGKIYIGIDDNGDIVGIQNPDEIMLKATNAMRDSIKPDITLFSTCDREIINGKTIVAITILKMIKETSGDNYEELRSLNQELTFEYFDKEFKEANINIGNAQMRSLGLVGEDGLYRNLGLLLSDQCIHTIKVAVFEGKTKEIFKDRYEFTGSLFKQLRECYSFIDRYNRTRSEFEGLKRIDIRDYPTTAIRESLLNSIVHKDYSFSGSTLISIYDDRIEFVTIGGLVRGISKDDMLLGVSILRNKNLGNIFYRLKLIEAFGTGIPKIMESYENGLLSPKIETTDNAFKITLFNNLYETENLDQPFKEKMFYTEGEQKVLNIFLTKAVIKRLDVEKSLSISEPMAIKYLKSLLHKDAIVKIGNGKNIQYRLK